MIYSLIRGKIALTLKRSPGIYCLYRRIRAFLISIIPKKYFIKRKWMKIYGVKINLINPVTYNEKIQWLKIYGYRSDLAVKCADKYLVREYIERVIGSKYLNELFAVYDSIDAINFNELPDKFVIKATHDSGSVLIVKNKMEIDKNKIEEIKCNMRINYAHISKEWVYEKVKPRIIVEKYMENKCGEPLRDYKVFCFSGIPKIIQVDIDRFTNHKRDFYDTKWNKIDLEILYESSGLFLDKPDCLEEMLLLSEKLSEEFIHVRVDWYVYENRLVFGEMTFFHESGFGKFNKKEWEIELGNSIIIDNALCQ